MALLKSIDNASLQATDGKVLLDTGLVSGSAEDFAFRLRRLLPTGWFPAPPDDGATEAAPVLAAILLGFGSILSGAWTLLVQCQSQMRLATMSGAFLDMAAQDYFGASGLPRSVNESDLRYRRRVAQSLVAQCNTRAAVEAAVQKISGSQPIIIEPTNAADCHALGAVAAPSMGGGYGYGTSGLRYGSLQGGQFFVETVSGRNSDNNAIFQAVSQSAAMGVAAWVRIED